MRFGEGNLGLKMGEVVDYLDHAVLTFFRHDCTIERWMSVDF